MQHAEQKWKTDEDSPREDRDPECCTAPPSGRRFFFSVAPAWVRWRRRAERVGRGGGRRGKGTSCSRPAPTLVSKLKWHLSATFNRRLAKLQLQFLTFLEVKGQRLTSSRKTFQEHTLINRPLSCIVTIYSTTEHNSCCWIFKSGCSSQAPLSFFFSSRERLVKWFFIFSQWNNWIFFYCRHVSCFLSLPRLHKHPARSVAVWVTGASQLAEFGNQSHWMKIDPNLLIRGESLSNQLKTSMKSHGSQMLKNIHTHSFGQYPPAIETYRTTPNKPNMEWKGLEN